MKNLKLKLWFISVIIIFMIPFFVINPTAPVMAAEEDEEDNFTSMPNYRWFNESITDAAVQEQLITNDVYQISNTNLNPTDTQKIEKSRALNSRDLYFDTRFNMDMAGNQTEYFRDVLGDECDFTEGDAEGWTAVSAGTVSVLDGILIDWRGVSDATWGIRLITSFSADIYHTLKLKIRGEGDSNFRWQSSAGSGQSINSGDVPDDWTIFEVDLTLGTWNGVITVFDILFATNNIATIYIDYIGFIGSLDYATHAEGEIEDTWDWEDSKEYWFDVKQNISDFNDGTTENITTQLGSESVEIVDGWYHSTHTTSQTDFRLNRDFMSIDSSVYSWITIELYTTTGEIDYVRFYDSGNNILGQVDDNVAIDTKALVSLDLDLDADWTGTETGLDFVIHYTTSANHDIYLNFTFLYDVSLGDVEGYKAGIGWAGDYHYVNPQGYYTADMEEGSGGGDNIGDYQVRNIDTSIFNKVNLKIRASENSRFTLYGVDETSTGRQLAPTQGLTGGVWLDFSCIPSDYSVSWLGIFEYLYVRVLELGGDSSFEGDEIFDIDYFLIIGEFDHSEGFKYSLLNRDHEEGMKFEFTKNNVEYESYNITIDFMDSLGTVLHYTSEFNYSITDGWLDLSVKLNLNKKNIRLTFKYENGTTILSIRSLYELYGQIGTPNLLLFDIGYPRLCINGSLDPMSRYTIQIDYIDADWVIIDWQKPDGECPVITGHTQSMVSSLSLSPYGLVVDDEIGGLEYAWFMLNIDRFDGFSAELSTFRDGLDAGVTFGDFISMEIVIANVRKNGTLDKLARHRVFNGLITPNDDVTYHNYLYEEDGTEIDLGKRTVAAEESKSSVSFYLDQQRNELIIQTVSDKGSTELRAAGNVSRSTTITSEMVIFVAYAVADYTTSGSNDYLTAELAGVDIVRKDLLGDIAGAILSPLIEGLAFIVSLFMIPIMWILSGLVTLGQSIIDGLSPIIEAVTTALSGAISSATGAISGVITGMQTVLDAALGAVETAVDGVAAALAALAEGIWTQLLTLSASIATFLEDIFTLIIPLLTDLVNDYFTWLLGFYEDILNNLMFIVFDEIIAALGLTDLITLMLGYFTDVLTVLGSIIILITVVMGFFFESAVYWFVPARFEAAMMVIGLIIIVWAAYPLIALWTMFLTGNYDLDQAFDAFESFADKIFIIVKVMWAFISYVFEFMLSLLTTIGGFIPLT